jgi:hypothetical protein
VVAAYAARTTEGHPEISARILEVLADPAAAARVYGHTSSSCSCCGRRWTFRALSWAARASH